MPFTHAPRRSPEALEFWLHPQGHLVIRLSLSAAITSTSSDSVSLRVGTGESRNQCSANGTYFAHTSISSSLVQPSEKAMEPTPVLLPGKSHEQRSLVGCSPWGREELGTTERLHFCFSLSCTGEGNGNPLQCSCLENPRDRRA